MAKEEGLYLALMIKPEKLVGVSEDCCVSGNRCDYERYF